MYFDWLEYMELYFVPPIANHLPLFCCELFRRKSHYNDSTKDKKHFVGRVESVFPYGLSIKL